MHTQHERILDLLLTRKEQGAFVYELIAPRPKGLGVAQYNARILELRRRGYAIINDEPGHFVLTSMPKTENVTNWTLPMLESELANLRDAWMISTASGKKKIENQAEKIKEQIGVLKCLI